MKKIIFILLYTLSMSGCLTSARGGVTTITSLPDTNSGGELYGVFSIGGNSFKKSITEDKNSTSWLFMSMASIGSVQNPNGFIDNKASITGSLMFGIEYHALFPILRRKLIPEGVRLNLAVGPRWNGSDSHLNMQTGVGFFEYYFDTTTGFALDLFFGFSPDEMGYKYVGVGISILTESSASSTNFRL